MTEMMLNGNIVEIDDECVPFVLFFNRNGLTTQFCCEGHKRYAKFYIIFDDSVTDEKIMNFNKKYWWAYDGRFPFNKWLRVTSKDGMEYDSIEEFNRISTSSYNEKYHEILQNWVFVICSDLFNDVDMKKNILDEIYSNLIHIETTQ